MTRREKPWQAWISRWIALGGLSRRICRLWRGREEWGFSDLAPSASSNTPENVRGSASPRTGSQPPCPPRFSLPCKSADHATPEPRSRKHRPLHMASPDCSTHPRCKPAVFIAAHAPSARAAASCAAASFFFRATVFQSFPLPWVALPPSWALCPPPPPPRAFMIPPPARMPTLWMASTTKVLIQNTSTRALLAMIAPT